MGTQAKASAGAVINREEALERFGGNEALFRRLALKFLDDAHFGELEAALARADASAAQAAAHSLKGVAGNLSFDELYGACCALNDALREGDLESAQDLLPRARRAYHQVCEALREMEA
ncbi:Hpt domain-containing protein [Rubneribacter sp.]